MSRRVLISGLGPVSGLGLGIEPMWEALEAGRSAVGPPRGFDASGFDCRYGCEVPDDFKVSKFVPKSYRKATKVMARDIEFAVAAADLAARHAKLATRATLNGDADAAVDYDPTRMGAHIGAGLIACELGELTYALDQARGENGDFDYHKWGRAGMNDLTPLWLLKYLPNMLACHVTILHDSQGPSNTITCCETSGMLSVGESMRVIQRGDADVCFCGGLESKMNPMSFLRQIYTGRCTTQTADDPATLVRPFDEKATGTVAGEGGAIVILEAEETFEGRRARAANDAKPTAYAKLLGFGASQTVNPAQRNMVPDEQGRGIELAVRRAIAEAGIEPDAIDLIVPFGIGHPAHDAAEANALVRVFGDGAGGIPVASNKPFLGLCGAGASGLDVAIAAMAVHRQMLPPAANCDSPRCGLNATTRHMQAKEIRHALAVSTGLGGQNAAVVLGRAD